MKPIQVIRMSWMSSRQLADDFPAASVCIKTDAAVSQPNRFWIIEAANTPQSTERMVEGTILLHQDDDAFGVPTVQRNSIQAVVPDSGQLRSASLF